MITQDEAIALAREFGLKRNGQWCFDEEELQDMLTYFANAVRKQTLLEAAEVATCSRFGSRIIEEVIAEELRRMAGEE